MPRIPILGGAYKSRAIIASSQRCVNLYPEANEDEQAPVKVTHFPCPGAVRRGVPPALAAGRCVYRTTFGELFEVVGPNIYFVDSTFTYHLVGAIPNASTPVSMADNGLVILVVDGSPRGWAIRMSDHLFGEVVDPNFRGGDFVGYVDTFFTLNVPGYVDAWYISLQNVTYANLVLGVITGANLYPAFDPLDFAAKTGSTDPILSLMNMHRNVWTLGELYSEVWYNAGSPDFTFAPIPGVYIEHGTAAKYSVAAQDLSIFWLAQSRQGKIYVLEGDASYRVRQISPRGLEAIWAKFQRVDDAVGACYSILGHLYYVLSFPAAGRTFQYEKRTGEWNELAYTGPNGLERYRGQSFAEAYGDVVVMDYSNGTLYRLDANVFTFDGTPISRVRTIPHLLNDGKRFSLDRVIADVQGGTLANTAPPPYAVPIQQIITQLGLTNGLKLLLEAGNLPSWAGSGQKWLDESGGGYDFFLGADGSASSSDPGFNGRPGGMSLSEYWGPGVGVGGDYFTYDLVNEPWMNNLHKNNAKFTILAQYMMGTANFGIMGTNASNGGIVGVCLLGDSVNQRLVWAVGVSQNSFITANGTLQPNAWYVSGISLDEAVGPNGAFCLHNGVITAFNSTYPSPSAGAASTTLQVGAGGGATTPMVAGSRLAWIAIWEGVALTQSQMRDLNDAIQANNVLPSQLDAPPQIFLRISYDRGASFSDYLESSFGDTGDYGILPWWPNLGVGRDIVLELSWSAPIDTALNGLFIEATEAAW